MKCFSMLFLMVLIHSLSFAEQENDAVCLCKKYKYEKKYEKNYYKVAIEELFAVGVPKVSFVNKKIDELDTLFDKLPANFSPDSLHAMQSVISDSLTKFHNAADKIVGKVPNDDIPNSAIPSMDKAGLNKAAIPGIDLQDAQSGLGEYDSHLKKLNVPDVKSNIPEVSDVKNISSNPDQFIYSKASQVDAIKEFKDQSGSADKQYKDLMGQKGDVEKYGNADQYKSMVNQHAMEKMNELFTEHADKLEAAQNQMAKLKRKYSYVPNSADLSTAVKINSLKGEPFKKRLIVGANFKFEKGNPLTLDFAPVIMYKFNKVFHAGVSGSYRASINYDDKNFSTNPQDVLGASALARHFLLKSFFTYSEFEYKSSTFSYDGKNWSSLSEREWVPGLLAGIGRELSLMGKLKGTVVLTYDFLHSEKSFSKSPWGFKFGFHLDDLDLKNRRKEQAKAFLETL